MPGQGDILDNNKLKEVLAKHMSGIAIDAVEDDGVFGLPWRSTETFYRHTEEYVSLEKRAAYRAELERAFPGKKAVL